MGSSSGFLSPNQKAERRKNRTKLSVAEVMPSDGIGSSAAMNKRTADTKAIGSAVSVAPEIMAI